MKKTALLFAGVIALAIAGCGNPTAAACEEFVTHWDSLECTGDTDNPIDCSVYNDYPCDISGYFNCLTDGYSCDGETFEADVADCTVESC
jgi:hypothetical protein